MDALREEAGQAAIFAVALLAIGALAIAGLRGAEARIVAESVARMAGEAAIEAATSVVADAYASEIQDRAADPSRQPREMRSVVSDPAVLRSARAAGDQTSLANGGRPLEDLAVTCARGLVTVAAELDGTKFRAGFRGSECSQP